MILTWEKLLCSAFLCAQCETSHNHWSVTLACISTKEKGNEHKTNLFLVREREWLDGLMKPLYTVKETTKRNHKCIQRHRFVQPFWSGHCTSLTVTFLWPQYNKGLFLYFQFWIVLCWAEKRCQFQQKQVFSFSAAALSVILCRVVS